MTLSEMLPKYLLAFVTIAAVCYIAGQIHTHFLSTYARENRRLNRETRASIKEIAETHPEAAAEINRIFEKNR